jgi:hypothetical protein
VLDRGLDVLFLLMSAVLTLDVFGRAAAEVVGPVFFRDDVSTPAPGTTDQGGETPNFCLDLRALNSICPSFQLLPRPLKCGGVRFGGEHG